MKIILRGVSLAGVLGLATISTMALSQTALEVGASRDLGGGWFELRPEEGLGLQLLDGWNANRAENGNGPITLTGPGDARVMVWPVFVAASAEMPRPEAVLLDFARREAAGVQWGAPSAFGDSGVQMFGTEGGFVAQASFVSTTSQAGLSGFWYFSEAPRDTYADLQPILARLMQGVHLYGPTTGQPAAVPSALRYVDWQEPNEGAYTMQVPEGWQVQGGILRPGPLRLQDVFEMISADGMSYAFFGDPNLPLFKTPTQMDAQMGMTEGNAYGGTTLYRYVPAKDYLPNYIQQRFGSQCAGLEMDDVQDQTDLSDPYNAQFAQAAAPGTYQHVDVAVGFFHCGQGTAGMAQMATYITGSNDQYGTEGFGIWQVSSLTGFVAPQAQAGDVAQALITTLSSRRIDQRWQQSNADMVAQIQQISHEAATKMSAQIAQRYTPSAGTDTGTGGGGTGGLSDDLERRWQNGIMDQTDVVDPDTGQSYKVEAGANYYWIDPQGGTIAGTDAPSQPAVNFSEMTELP